jgi:hypothetical protein
LRTDANVVAPWNTGQKFNAYETLLPVVKMQTASIPRANVFPRSAKFEARVLTVFERAIKPFGSSNKLN